MECNEYMYILCDEQITVQDYVHSTTKTEAKAGPITFD